MTKINQTLKKWPKGTVALQSWLRQQGVYQQLLLKYEKSEWVKRVGKGAYTRSGDTVDWTGALYAVQRHAQIPVFVGGKTALDFQGKSQYTVLAIPPTYIVHLFSPHGTRLPKWFSDNKWGVKVENHTTNLFSHLIESGITEIKIDSYSVRASAPERAIMELLYLVPRYASLDEASNIFENLFSLRSELVQSLLESCQSIKVKRLFMFLAEFYQLSWTEKIDQSKIDFGSGKRKITEGYFDSKFRITVPEQFRPEKLEK